MALAAKCCLCTDEFSSIDDLEAHISADHFNCLPFECEKCKFAKFPTEFAIKRHYEEDHGLVEYFVRYRVSREIYEKKQKVRECLERCVCHSALSADAGEASHQGKTTISVEYLHQPHHQYQAHLHESEFLTPSKGRRSAPSPSDLFQSQHRTSVPTSSTELRHHQSELLGGEIGGHEHDSVHAFDQMGTSSLIGNLLEHIKPDMDGNVLSHFDQLYAADLAQAGEGMGAKGIDKIIITSQQQQQHQEPDLGTLLAQHKEAQIASIGVGSTGVNVVNTGLIGKPPLSINGPTFSLSHSAENRPKKPPELQCQVCKQMVVNRSTSLMYHVNVKHLKLAIFKCKQCGEEFLWNRPAANRHAKRHGGDESLIENNTERLFPILNRHRREYFNLAYGKSSPIGAQGSGSANILQEQLSGGGGEEEQRMELDEQQQQINGEPKKETDSGDELSGTEAKKTGTMTKAMSTEENHERNGMDKDGQTTPNSILAQLIDMTRSADASSATRQTDVQMPPSSTPGQTPQQQQENPEEGTNKVQKSVKCEGCGDLVINQEWILLNHVNTKHLHLPLYKCVSCDKPFENYLRSYAVRHTKFYHAGDESLLLDQRDQFWAGLRETCSRLFGIGKNAIDGAEHGIDQ